MAAAGCLPAISRRSRCATSTMRWAVHRCSRSATGRMHPSASSSRPSTRRSALHSRMRKRFCSPVWATSRSRASARISTRAWRVIRDATERRTILSAGSEDRNQYVLKAFSDPEAVARYREGPPRFVPGFDALHRMTGILLAEQAPRNSKLLVLGAGGGLELKALAQARPDWTFVGVDPSQEMLRLAEHTLGPLMTRVELVQGYIDDAPAGPFDAATCLLTLHFLDARERQRTAREIHRRLKPGAPFVAAHGSFPQGPRKRAIWVSRYAAYAVASGVDPERAKNARAALDSGVSMLSPEQDEEILRDAGFADVDLFFAAFTWRGWIANA